MIYQKTSKHHYSKYLKNPNSNSFFITLTNNEEVLSEMKNLKKDKSSQPSSIPIKILKLFQAPLSKPISLIANLSFSTGIFPANLKTANVILIFKKDDHTSCNNYRPISLLSNISKIIERLIHSRLMMFLNANRILYERQFDFRHNHSTTHALSAITFDTVNHNILLKKLEYYGIRNITNSWFQSYLNDRMQFTTVNKCQSSKKLLKYGVRQGSVLGPLLFILFINDLHKAIEFSSVHHFADDTNLIITDKSMKKINKHINRDFKLVVEWIRANRLSLNTSKTELVIFKSKNKIITKHLNFHISGQKIKPSSQVKYLGIILQDDLHWNSHLTKLRKKLSQSVGLISKVSYYVPKYLLRTIYYSIFNSNLIYTYEILGQNQKTCYFKKLAITFARKST